MSLVLPIAFGQFMLALVGASDALMLGMVNQDALSAVSLAGKVQFVQNLFLNALTIGTSVFAAQYWGKGDHDAIERLFANVIRISAVISFVFFMAAELMPRQLMLCFTKDPVLVDGGASYLCMVGPSYLLCGLSHLYLCI